MKEEEKEILSVIVMDNITGGWLLFPRSKQYFALQTELQNALKAINRDVRQKLIVEEYTKLRESINMLSTTYY